MNMDTEKEKRVLRRFYLVLDSHRESLGLSWRGVARESQVEPATLSRLKNGKSPHLFSFFRLLDWSGIDIQEHLPSARPTSTPSRVLSLQYFDDI